MKDKRKRDSDMALLIRLFQETKTRSTYFIVGGMSSLTAAFFAGVSASLLILLTKGLVERDFAFVWRTPLLEGAMGEFLKPVLVGNLELFILVVGLVFLSACMKSVFAYAASLASLYQSNQLTHQVRTSLYSRYLSYGKLFFDRSNIGSLMDPLTRSTYMIRDMLTRLGKSFISFFILLVYVAIMFVISWKLTLLVLLIFPFVNYFIKPVVGKISEASTEVKDSYRTLMEKISNVFSCVPLVKSYAGEDEESKAFDAVSSQVSALHLKMGKRQALVVPLQEILILVSLVLLTSVMAYLSMRGQFGEVTVFLVYLYLLRVSMNAFSDLAQFSAMLASVRGPISEILGALNVQDKPVIRDGIEQFRGLKERIDFHHLSFSYVREIPILKDLSFSAKRGKMTAIVGATGSGKTTLIHLLLRFYDVPAGTITLDGVDIRNFTLQSLTSHMAFVSQETLLFNDTLRHNIAYGLNGKLREQDLIESTKKARLYGFIKSLPEQFDTLVGDRGVKLSGGEKQRVALARAFLKGSEILLLDEATSALDTQTEQLIQEAIDEAVKDRTALVVAHRLSTIRHADHIVVIEEGRLVEEGPLAELLERKGRFHQYWAAQKFD